MGFRAPVSQDSNTPTRTVASSPSPGTYAAPSLLTPWGRNTWAHMSADVFIFFYTKRGNMFHNKCLHTLEQNFFFIFLRERKKMRQWETETTLGEASWSFIPLKCFYHPTWKEPACLLGKICAKVWIPGVRTRTKFPSWDRRETVNRLDVRTLRIQARKPKLRDMKAPRLRDRNQELERYRSYVINHLRGC